MDLGIHGRVALVAAASHGLGKAVALKLALEGARVAICARSEAVEEAAREIAGESGGEVMAARADVTDAGQVARLAAQVRERFGAIDMCVANAGGPPSKKFAETTVEDWRAGVDLNLMSTIHLARETLPGMRERGWGRFLAITSVAVKQPIDGLILSNSVRAAVVGLVKTLANEYGPYGVLVNNICPGYTATARLEGLRARLAAAEGVSEEEIERRWTAQIPQGRLGRVEEFADAAAFLVSERAGYINGVSVAVDGGLSKGLM